MRPSFLILQAALIASASAVDPVVHLDYTSYRGTAQPNGVSEWLGVRYAAPPVGDLRFRAPEDPEKSNRVQDANEFGPICLNTDGGAPDDSKSEDCLFMNIYAPSNATKDSKHPVYLFIQGGGFNSNSNPNYNGSGLIMAGDMDMVVINFNYRVGPYGFLAGDEVVEDGSLNNGLKDQRKAMHWVQKHAASFGGDPDHVTIGGASAGAQSVDLHVTAYGGRDDGLFHATAAESQSFPGLRNVTESQFAYDGLTNRTGCAEEADTLACLRNLSATALQESNTNIPFPGRASPPLYMYGPTLDHDFITDYTVRAYRMGAFVRVPALAGDDQNEGTTFAPQDLATTTASSAFLADQFPALTPTQLAVIADLYPVTRTRTFEGKARYWRQAAWAYGELRYVCPSLQVAAQQARLDVPSYHYRWNVVDPPADESGLGVSHTVEVNAVWGPRNSNPDDPLKSYLPDGVNAPVVPLAQAYWANFIRRFDPNAFALPEGAPEWGVWGPGEGEGAWRRLMVQTDMTAMEDVAGEQRRRCAYLDSIALELKQ